jgi:hypothetical protein
MAAAQIAILAKRMSEVLTGALSLHLAPFAGRGRRALRVAGEGVQVATYFQCWRMEGPLSPQERGEGAHRASGIILYVPRGLTRRVGIALAGSSGQGCRG